MIRRPIDPGRARAAAAFKYYRLLLFKLSRSLADAITNVMMTVTRPAAGKLLRGLLWNISGLYLDDINMCNTPLGEPPLVDLYGDICQREANIPRIIIISPRMRAIFMKVRWRVCVFCTGETIQGRKGEGERLRHPCKIEPLTLAYAAGVFACPRGRI